MIKENNRGKNIIAILQIYNSDYLWHIYFLSWAINNFHYFTYIKIEIV